MILRYIFNTPRSPPIEEPRGLTAHVQSFVKQLTKQSVQWKNYWTEFLEDLDWNERWAKLHELQNDLYNNSPFLAVFLVTMFVLLLFYRWRRGRFNDDNNDWSSEGCMGLGTGTYKLDNEYAETRPMRGYMVLNRLLHCLKKHSMFFPKLNFVFIQYVVDSNGRPTSGNNSARQNPEPPSTRRERGGLGCGSWTSGDDMHSSFYGVNNHNGNHRNNNDPNDFRRPHQLIAPDGRIVELVSRSNHNHSQQGGNGNNNKLRSVTQYGNGNDRSAEGEQRFRLEQKDCNANANTSSNSGTSCNSSNSSGAGSNNSRDQRQGRKLRRKSMSSVQPYVLESIAEENEYEENGLPKGWHQIYTPEEYQKFRPLTPPMLRSKGSNNSLYNQGQMQQQQIQQQQQQQQQQQMHQQHGNANPNVNILEDPRINNHHNLSGSASLQSKQQHSSNIWGYPSYYEPNWLYRHSQTKYVSRGTNTSPGLENSNSNTGTSFEDTYEEVCRTTLRDRMPIFWRSKGSKKANQSTKTTAGSASASLTAEEDTNDNEESDDAHYHDEDYSNYDWSTIDNGRNSIGSTSSISTAGMSTGASTVSTGMTSVYSGTNSRDAMGAMASDKQQHQVMKNSTPSTSNSSSTQRFTTVDKLAADKICTGKSTGLKSKELKSTGVKSTGVKTGAGGITGICNPKGLAQSLAERTSMPGSSEGGADQSDDVAGAPHRQSVKRMMHKTWSRISG